MDANIIEVVQIDLNEIILPLLIVFIIVVNRGIIIVLLSIVVRVVVVAYIIVSPIVIIGCIIVICVDRVIIVLVVGGIVRILVVLVGIVLTGVKFVVIPPAIVCAVIIAFGHLDQSREAESEEEPSSKPLVCGQVWNHTGGIFLGFERTTAEFSIIIEVIWKCSYFLPLSISSARCRRCKILVLMDCSCSFHFAKRTTMKSTWREEMYDGMHDTVLFVSVKIDDR